MNINVEDLSNVLKGCEISDEMQEAIIEYADWTYGDIDKSLVRANTVMLKMLAFVENNDIEAWEDSNKLSLTEDEMKHMIRDTFSALPKDSYIDISH